MYQKASKTLNQHADSLSSKVSNWVSLNHPSRTTEHHKCYRDVNYIINSLSYCLNEGSMFPIIHISTMFYTNSKLQLSSTDVEFLAYDYLLSEIELLFTEVEDGAVDFCKSAIEILKKNLQV